MDDIIERYMHQAMVLLESKTPGKSAAVYSYIAPKMYMVRDWVAEDHPGVKVIKIFSVGTKKYEIEREKYYALYKKSSSVQARVPDATEAW
jgi:hypothetical protein